MATEERVPAPHAAPMDRDGAVAAVLSDLGAFFDEHWSPELTLGEWWQRLGRSGWGFPAWPAEWFGRGLSGPTARAVINERFRRGVFGPPSGISTFLAAPTILAYGTEDQKQRYLPGIATGTDVWCQLFSEPEAGSDMASLRTRAERDGDEWAINGQKVWSSGAQFARYGILIARTDPEVPKHKGITYFLIDMEQPGVEVRPLREMTGEAAFNEVFFTDARVSELDRLGELGEGWRVAMTTLSNERDPNNPGLGGGGGALLGRPDLSMTVAEYLRAQSGSIDAFSFAIGGGASALFDTLVERFGAAADPVFRQRRAALHSDRITQRWTGARAKANAKSGQPGPEVSTLKLGGSNVGRELRDLGLAAMGAHGMLADADAPSNGMMQRYALFVPATSIAGGSDQVQRNIIGERALGLPKEPDVSRDLPFSELKVSARPTGA